MATYSSTPAWKIPWMEEPGRLQSKGLWRVGHNRATSNSTFHFHALEKKMATHSSVLAWRIPGIGVPSGLLSMGWHRVGHNWSNLAAAAAAAVYIFTFLNINNICLVSHSCATLWIPMGSSLPGSSVSGILQARILESVFISSSRGFSQPRDQSSIYCISCTAGTFFFFFFLPWSYQVLQTICQNRFWTYLCKCSNPI